MSICQNSVLKKKDRQVGIKVTKKSLKKFKILNKPVGHTGADWQ